MKTLRADHLFLHPPAPFLPRRKGSPHSCQGRFPSSIGGWARGGGKIKILVALSGGVDSSVAACLLKAQGHDVVGVHLRLWQDPSAPALAKILPSKCCTLQSLHRVKAVARSLALPLHIIDLSKEFKRSVVDPFVNDYRRGLTPNPCVLCNPHFKFRHLLLLAKKYSCDAVATGHYARTAVRKRSGKRVHILLEARDHSKDQSYYLYRLSQEQMKNILFPLGDLLKTEVYALAKKFKIPLERTSYRESQNLCFFPEKDTGPFLHRSIKTAPGMIFDREGKVLGRHEGLPFYTVGQRRGLLIGGLKIPLYIVRKDQRRNALIVAPRGDVLTSSIPLRDCTWINGKAPKSHPAVEARIRSLGNRHRGTVAVHGTSAVFTLKKPIEPVAPGQSVMLYRGKEVLGGGMAKEA
ncbi:MAG: tRNA 2-thiouridine(34) synthase MnmA [Candidatus Peregrinibacteria bacterium]